MTVDGNNEMISSKPEKLWREHVVGDVRLMISNQAYDRLKEGGGRFGGVATDLVRMMENPESFRNLDHLAHLRDEESEPMFVRSLGEVMGAPVMVKRAMESRGGKQKDNLMVQFKTTCECVKNWEDRFSLEQKQVLRFAEAYAYVRVGSEEFLLMEEVKGEGMSVDEPLPDVLAEVFGVEKTGSSMGDWDALETALISQKGMMLDDVAPRNVIKVESGEGGVQCVLIDQGATGHEGLSFEDVSKRRSAKPLRRRRP